MSFQHKVSLLAIEKLAGVSVSHMQRFARPQAHGAVVLTSQMPSFREPTTVLSVCRAYSPPTGITRTFPLTFAKQIATCQ